MTFASAIYELGDENFMLCKYHAEQLSASWIDICDDGGKCEKCDDDVLRCPECGCTDVEVILRVEPTLHFAEGKEPTVSDFMFRSGEDECTCANCGHEWIE